MSREEITSEKFIKVYNKNEVIFSENSSGNEMYIVCSGWSSSMLGIKGDAALFSLSKAG